MGTSDRDRAGGLDRYRADLTAPSSNAPGRSPRTAKLPASMHALAGAIADQLRGTSEPVVQAHGDLELDGAEAQAIASAGVGGASGTLPFLAQIQAAFGRHDVSGVRAQVGGAARDASAALGANAYATGDRVGFAQAPDLFLAAHEAAHVVQQRGGVQLSGGVGARGDRHEQHADAVAAAVVAGRSAESLLDRYAGSGGGPVVQRDPNDASPTLRISELRHLGRGRWVHRDGRPLSPRERGQLREALVQHARDQGMPDEEVAQYRRWLDYRDNPPIDPQSWQDHHLPALRGYDRARATQDTVLPENDPNRSCERTNVQGVQGPVDRIYTEEENPEARVTVRPLGGTRGDSFSMTGPDGERVHRVDMQDEVVAPGDDACITSGAASCAVTSLHHDAPGGDRLRLGHPAAATGGPQYNHLEESVVLAAREGGNIRGVVRIHPAAQQRPSRSDPAHLDDDFHTFPQSNDELRARLAARLANEFGAENVSREGPHIIVRGDDGQVRSRISIGVVRAPLDESGDAVVQHVVLTRNGTVIGNPDGGVQTIPHDEAHLHGEPEDDAEAESPPTAPSAPSSSSPSAPTPPSRAQAPADEPARSDAARADEVAPADAEEPARASRQPAVVTRPTIPVGDPSSDAEPERDPQVLERGEADDDTTAASPPPARTSAPTRTARAQAPADEAAPADAEAPAADSRPPAVVRRPTIPVGGPPMNDAERERGAGLARNVRFALHQRMRDGTPEQRARAEDGLRQLDTLGNEPHPEAVRRIANAADVPAVEPDHEPADPPRSRAGSTLGETGVDLDVDQNGASINIQGRNGGSGGAGVHVQHGGDGIEGGDVALMAGQGDVRGTISAGVTYTARRPRRSGNRYSVSWKIEIRASAGLHARLRGMGVGATRGGAITREGTDMFESLEAANEFRDSFRDLTDERIIERFFRTVRGDQGTYDWWIGQSTGTTRSVQLRATLTPSIKGTLARICEVGLSVPMCASASAEVRKTAERAVEVTESFEVGAGVDPSFGAAGFEVHGTLGTGIDNNVRYCVTYVFAVDLDAGRAAFEQFLARSGLIWEGQAGVTEVSHSRTTETSETFGASVGPLGSGHAARGTRRRIVIGPDGEEQVVHSGFQHDVYNDIRGTYGRRGIDVTAPVDDHPYQIRTDIHSSDGDASTRALGQATGTSDAAATGGLRSSGNWVINEQLTQAQAAEFHRNFIRGGRPRGGWAAVHSLYSTLRNIPTDESGRDGRAEAITEFISHEGRRGLDFIYGYLRERPTQEVSLYTQEGEDTNFMREADLRAMEGRIPGYEQAIAEGRGTAIAPRIQADIALLEPRLAAVSDRSRYTDLGDELRDRVTTRYRSILERLRPLYRQARSGQAPQRTGQESRRTARADRVFRESNLTANAPGSSVPLSSPRLSAPDPDEDRDILDHIEVRGLHVLVDERPFSLDAGIVVSMIAARRAGEQGGMTRFRVTLQITEPMPGEETVDAHAEEGPVPNRVGQRFHRIVLGRERDPAPRAAPVQGKGALGGGDVHATAAHGISGSGTALPFLEQIQRAFGRHDVSTVRAHIGGSATAATAALGAEAYATGDAVAFRGAPDLHTAAHEAAHVIQQRGGVQLPGDVGTAGDAYERHADRVADAVVAGRSAEELLDIHAGRAPAVQRRAVQLAHRVGRNDTESVSWVMAVAQGDDLAAMRALYHALDQAARRRTTSGDNDHVVCVAGRDDYDLVLSQESADGLRATLARRMSELQSAAHDSAVAQGTAPMSRDDGRSMPDRDQAFADRFNVEFRSILPSLRESDRVMSGGHDARSTELTGEELRLLFSSSQRAKLMRYFGDHVVPDRLFNSGDSGTCNAHQRIVISSHILSHGQIREGSFAQDLHARYCGHWVQIVHAYAGVVDSAGAGVAQQFDHDGNQVMGTGRAHTEFHGARQRLTEQEREEAGGGQRQFRQAGLPVERFDTIQPGDWLYLYTGTNTPGGNHSVVFSRWLGELQTHSVEGSQPVQYRRAQLFGQQQVSEGGAQIEWYLGDRFTTVNGRRVYPITRVQRHDADETAPSTPEDLIEGELGRRPDARGRATLLPELGTGPAAQANFDTIARQERRLRGRLDLPRLIDWLRRINAPMIDQLGAQRTSEHDVTLMRQVNQGDDLDALIRLNERLCFRIANAEGLEMARQDQAARIEPDHEARVREVEDDIAERQAQIEQLNGEIDRAREVVDLDRQLVSLRREKSQLARRIRDKNRQLRSARRPDVQERMRAQIAGWQTRLGEVEAAIARLEGQRAGAAEREQAGRVTTRIGNPAMRERLARLERRRDILEDEIEDLQASAGYYTAHPGTRQQLIGQHARERGEGTQRERITGRLTAVRPEVPWGELITRGEPGLVAEAQSARREAQRHSRRSRR